MLNQDNRRKWSIVRIHCCNFQWSPIFNIDLQQTLNSNHMLLVKTLMSISKLMLSLVLLEIYVGYKGLRFIVTRLRKYPMIQTRGLKWQRTDALPTVDFRLWVLHLSANVQMWTRCNTQMSPPSSEPTAISASSWYDFQDVVQRLRHTFGVRVFISIEQ